jgi:hypothetical protein
MIQGHTFTALAREDALHGAWLRLHGVLHGLTAPMFLPGGGLAYGIVSARRRSPAAGSPCAPGQASGPRAGRLRVDGRMLRRAVTLLLVGTLLQLPQAPIATWLEQAGLLARLSAVGPLQLVAVCLLFCEVLHALSRSRGQFLLMLASATALLSACAPWAWHARLSERLGPPLGMWLDGRTGSQFPLLPWGAFFLVGVLAGYLLPTEHRAAPRFGFRLLAAGVAGACGCAALYWAGLGPPRGAAAHEFWATSPLYVAFRAALVFAWLGFLIALSPQVSAARRALPRLSELLDVLARQSLVAYVVHLFWLYGSPLTDGLVRLGRCFSLGEALAIFTAVALHTTAVTLVWDRYPPERVLARLGALRGKLPLPLRGGADSPGAG